MRWSRRPHRSIVSAFVLCLGLVAQAGGIAAAAESDPPVLLRLSTAQIRTAGVKLGSATIATSEPPDGGVARGIGLAGKVIAPGDASGVILTTVSGQLEAVLVQIGSAVRAGQPLARIGSPQVAALQREYLQARAALELAASRVSRDEALFADGIISESRLRETRSARQMAGVAEQEQRKQLSLAGYSDAAIRAIGSASVSSAVTIYAPADAVVLEQSAAVGQHVEPGTELFRLGGARGWWLELHAPVRHANDIRVGDIVSIAGCELTGRVIAVGSQLESASQTVMVRAQMSDGASSCVRLNQYVEADVRPASAPAGLVSIPAGALVRNADRDYVFVEQEGAFTPVPVTVERRHGDVVWLKGGLTAGTPIATAGITALKGAWLGFGPALETRETK